MKSFFYRTRRHIPKPIRHLVYRAGMFFGDEFAPPKGEFADREFPSVNATLTYLRDWGFRPRNIIDVGAFHGDWTRFVKTIFPESRVLMVEPQARWRLQLLDVCRYYGDVSVESALLGAADGVPVEFVEMKTGSSVYEEQSVVPRTRVSKETAALDSVLQRTPGFERIDLLKLDVQGYEIEVLKGARQHLDVCEFILVECSLIATNRGCPLVGEVIEFLNPRGFRLLDICSQIRRKDFALWQTDLLFINERSPLVPASEINAANW